MRLLVKQKLLSSLALGALAAVSASAAHADDTAAEIRLLKAQLRKLEAKVAAQERTSRETKVAVARVAVAGGGGAGAIIKGPAPVAFTCPGGGIPFKNVCITPGGYLDFATISRAHSTLSDLTDSWNNIPYRNNRIGHAQEERFSARASRFSLKVQGDVNPVTHITGYGEIDFQGAAQTANSQSTNSYQPRLRQAWVNVDRDDLGLHVMGGQSWTLATMFAKGMVLGKENIPITIDQTYLPGFTYARQAQIRITKDLGPFTVGVSAENPQTTVSGSAPALGAAPFGYTSTSQNVLLGNVVNPNCAGFNNGPLGASTNGDIASSTLSGFNTCNAQSLNKLPDFIGKASFDPTFAGRTIHLEGYGLLRDFYDRTGLTYAQVTPDGQTGTAIAGASNNVFGGGVGGSILVPILPNFVEVQFSGLFGQGIGRYGAGQLPDVTIGPDGRLKPIEESQLLAGVTVHPTSYLDFFVYAGQEEAQRTPVNGAPGVPGAGFGYGSLLSNNAGCNTEGSSLPCNGATHRLRQITGGGYYTAYKGAYGKLQIGAQYSYTQREGFTSQLTTTSPVIAAPKANENILLTSLRYFPF